MELGVGGLGMAMAVNCTGLRLVHRDIYKATMQSLMKESFKMIVWILSLPSKDITAALAGAS